MPKDINFDYQIAVVNGFDNEISSTGGGLRGARPGYRHDINENKALVGRLGWTFKDSYTIGISGYYGAYDEEDVTNDFIKGIGVDTKLAFTPGFWIEGEFVHFNLDDGVNNNGERVPSRLWGHYIQACYQFWPDFLNDTILSMWSDTPLFTLSLRYGHAEIATRVAGYMKEDRVTYGFNYRPHPNIVFKNEWQSNSGTIERGDKDGYVFSIAFVYP